MSGTNSNSITCWIDTTGIHAPTFEEVYTYLVGQYQAIYGTDVYLGNDSQDGQWIGVLAAALNDVNSMAIAVYNSYSPTGAQGVGLSSAVKINGITRSSATASTVDVTLTGTPGMIINNGQVRDQNNNLWNLPPSTTIPGNSLNGQIVVTATCTVLGAITAPPNTVNIIATPQAGWQAVTNVNAATPGVPIETDAALRLRQSQSTMQAAQTPLEAVQGAIAAIPGVTRLQVYENSTDLTDANGIPSHSIAAVVEGGDATLIAQAIAFKKTIGAGTYGSTSVTIADQFGVPHAYKFFRPTSAYINVAISIAPLTGYTTYVGNAIVSAIINAINSDAIGQLVSISKLYVPANLATDPISSATFNIKSLTLARSGGSFAAADIALAFNEVAVTSASQITLTVG